MKIEKVNDHQIKCTLTKADLADRELKLSELAYGTEKAKDLFRDMMQQANQKFGFEAEDIPLMIEAIPLNSDCIVLIITKVEDPEELDTRFSKFAPSVHTQSDDAIVESSLTGADDILDLFKKVSTKNNTLEAKEDIISQTEELDNKDELSTEDTLADFEIIRYFSFTSIDHITRVSHILSSYYDGINSLYKNIKTGKYWLIVSKSHHTPSEFNKICNTLSEYGHLEKNTTASEAFFEEYYDVLIKDNALQNLNKI
ncbi:MAG: adaptor protein MecA [Lachnospiraceae bacterium]